MTFQLKTQKVVILLLIQLHLSFLGLGADSNGREPLVRVFEVSNSAKGGGSSWTLHTGSVMGGTKLYIKVAGHSLVPSENIVTVGPYNCPVPEKGVSETTIMCETLPASNPNFQQDLMVNVKREGRPDSTCAGQDWNSCRFSFHRDYTPSLHYITPRSAIPGYNVTYYGVFLADQTIDITKLLIGDQQCSRFNDQLNEIESMDTKYSLTNHFCETSLQQEGGFYQATYTTIQGNARRQNLLTSVQSQALSTTYDFSVLPRIENLSANSGSQNGQVLTIQGSGFSPTEGNVVVTAGNKACNVLKSTLNEITCQVQSGASITTAPQISGSGVLYSTYVINDDIWNGDVLQDTLALPNNGGLVELQTNVIGEVDVQDDRKYTGHYFRGYFQVPRTGVYKFFIIGDDQASLYFTSTPNTSGANLKNGLAKIAESSYLPYHNIYYDPNQLTTAFSADLNLNGGDIHYFQVYGVNGNNWRSHFTMGAIMPNPDPNAKINSVPVIYKLDIQYTPVYQKISIQIVNSVANNKFKMRFVWDDYDNTSTNLDWNIDCPTFANFLDWTFQDYKAQCTKTQERDGSNVHVGNTWVVTYQSYRPSGKRLSPQIICSSCTVTITKLQSASAPVTGSFKINFDGQPVYKNKDQNILDWPYDTYTYDITYAIQEMWGETNIYDWSFRSKYDGYLHYFLFRTIDQNVPTFTVDGTNLKGDPAVGAPNIAFSVQQAGSQDFYFQSVPAEYLQTVSETSSVIVTVNGATSVCHAAQNCKYQSDNSLGFSVTSFTYSDPTLSVVVPSPVHPSITVTLNDLYVKFGDVECTQKTFDAATGAITCEATGIISGSYKPTVSFQPLGIGNVSGLSAHNVNPIISQVTQKSGGSNGGTITKIIGKHFPNSQVNLVVQLGTLNCNIISVTNTEINVSTPPQAAGTYQFQVTYNSLSGTNPAEAFIYNSNNVAVGVFTPISASPVLKGVITISGSNFGNDASQVRVRQQNTNNVYYLPIQTISDTEIVAILIGGTSGSFDIYVEREDYSTGKSANTFTYEITVTSVTPNQGSIKGGTVLTIAGTNFSTVPNQNNVFIGTSGICHVLTATSTQLTCQTSQSSEIDSILLIEVQGRLLEQASCDPNVCKFQFLTTLTPIVDKEDDQDWWEGQQIVTLPIRQPGPQIVAGGVGMKVFIGETEAVVKPTTTTTSLVFEFPVVKFGKYNLRIFVPGMGYVSHKYEFVTSNFWISCGAPNTGSQAGALLSFCGRGFDPDKKPKLVFENGAICEVHSWTIKSVQCRAPAFSDTVKHTITAIMNPLDPSGLWEKDDCPTCHYTADISKTPTVSSVSPLNVNTPASFTLTFSGVTGLTGPGIKVWIQLKGRSEINFWNQSPSVSGSTVSAVFTNIPIGTYLAFVVGSTGIAKLTGPTNEIIVGNSGLSASPLLTSYAGGAELTISGDGFGANLNPKVTVCGFQCPLNANPTYNSLKCTLPKLITIPSMNQYLFSTPISRHQPDSYFADSAIIDASLISDQFFDLAYSSASDNCYVGVDFGADIQIGVTQIQFHPDFSVLPSAIHHAGAQIQGFNGATWDDLYTVPNSVHIGKNIWRPASELSTQYSQFRYTHNFPGQSNRSNCTLVELEIFGNKYYSPSPEITTLSNVDCPIKVNVAGSVFSLSSQVVYDPSKSSVVSSVSPLYGSVLGNTVVTISGSGFSNTHTDLQVIIDGINCVVSASTLSSITCTTGPRPNFTPPSLVVKQNGHQSVNNGVLFYYGSLWSQSNTWGGEPKPVEGDSVAVPQGQTLVIDENPLGVLKAVIVDHGTVIFADNVDLNFDVQYFIVRHGQLMIGREGIPYQKKLTITLHGKFEDPQLPEVGNQGIMCHECVLDIHGKPRKTWTEISQTVNAGATTVKLIDPLDEIDWAVGEQVVIASTDFNHEHAETRTIVSYNAATKTLTLDQPLTYKHFSAIQQYGSQPFPMRAEIGLLSRNIVIQGDKEHSEKYKYGAHLMLHGKSTNGLIGRIEYAEFRYVGQPQIMGRYPIHFHMNGDVSDSYVRGNAVHHSYARVTTLHAVSFLTVQKNVGYRAAGHNIFLEDGIETHNVIRENLMVSTRQVFSMLQSDITAASYWITNPDNEVYSNRAAGGDFYGFWYELKEHPDGASTTSDICPQGLPLGLFEDNKAHSYVRFGLRVFVMAQRKFPCLPIRNDTAEDPWADNPSTQVVWTNFQTFQNQQDGVLCEFCGNMKFLNFKVADSSQSGFNVHRANLTKEYVQLQNWLIVGRSANYDPSWQAPIYTLARGIITPRTDGFLANGVDFYNFYDDMSPFQSCSECYHFQQWVQGGQQAHFQGIRYSNVVSTKKVFWQNWKKEIYWDRDGTLSQAGEPAFITPNYPHLAGAKDCSVSTEWADAVICKNGVQVRRLDFWALQPDQDFRSVQVKALVLDGKTPTDRASADKSLYGQSFSMRIKNHQKDNDYGFVAVLASKHTYNIHWKEGIDWKSLIVGTSQYWDATDAAVIVHFNYTDYREQFGVQRLVGGVSEEVNLPMNPNLLNNAHSTCQFGEWYHDKDNQRLVVCFSGKGRKGRFDKINITAYQCKDFCDIPVSKCTKDLVVRTWYDANSWLQTVVENGVSKTINHWSADSVVIPCEWIMKVVPDANLKSHIQKRNITVYGDLVFENPSDILIRTQSLNIHGGTLSIGQKDKPYTGKALIELTGTRAENSMFIYDQSVTIGNKLISVTGLLELYGVSPRTLTTRLASFAQKGDMKIKVKQSLDWKFGDEIVIGMTGIVPDGVLDMKHDRRTIVSVVGDEITLDSPLSFDHYGDANPTKEVTFANGIKQTLDQRAVVAHITRNIKIQGSNQDGWGCRVLVYHYINDLAVPQIDWKGMVKFDGVQMNNCGQRDTDRGAIDIRNWQPFAQIDPTNPVILQTVISRSSIHDCNGYCFNSQDSLDWQVTDNIFFIAKPIMMRVTNGKKQKVLNNFFLAAYERPQLGVSLLYDMTCFIYWWKNFDIGKDEIVVSGNVGQGSQGPGFIFPHIYCSEKDKTLKENLGFFDNHAASTVIGVMFKRYEGECNWAGRVTTASSGRGVMMNPTVPGIQVDNILSAQNGISLILRHANQGIDNFSFFRNSHIIGVTRPTCQECYSTGMDNCNGSGVQMLVVTANGEDFPWKKHPYVFDVVCNQEVFDARMYVSDVTFQNFQSTFPDNPTCQNNHAWTTHHGASDATAGHYLNNVKCVNCDEKNLFFFQSPKPMWLGWFGGCGEMLCTGPENVLMHDWSGEFLKKNAISHNVDVGPQVSQCKQISDWNQGYHCTDGNFALLEWQSVAPDRQARMHAPVRVSNQQYTNQINAFREWVWDGPEPANKRLNRFLALLNLNDFYEIKYNGLNPYQIIHQIQQRVYKQGEPDQYVALQVQYQVPLSIQVVVNQKVIKPNYVPAGKPYPVLNAASGCGSNNFFTANNTIQFVITGAPDCVVFVNLIDSVSVNLKIQMSVDDFFNNDRDSQFIDRVCAFLGISTDRLKIVSGTNVVSQRRFLEDITTTTTDSNNLSSKNTSNTGQTITSPVYENSIDPNYQGPQSIIEFLLEYSNYTGTIDPTVSYATLADLVTQLNQGFESGSLQLDDGVRVQQMVYTFNVGQDTDGTIITKEEVIIDGNSSGDSQVSSITLQEEEDQNQTLIGVIIGVIVGVMFIICLIGGYCVYKKYQQKKQAQAQAQFQHIGLGANIQNFGHVKLQSNQSSIIHQEIQQIEKFQDIAPVQESSKPFNKQVLDFNDDQLPPQAPSINQNSNIDDLIKELDF